MTRPFDRFKRTAMRGLTMSGWDFESVTAAFALGILAIVLRWAACERSRLHPRVPRRRRGLRRRTPRSKLAALAQPLQSLIKVPRVALPLMR
jgi:hypothetical protein